MNSKMKIIFGGILAATGIILLIVGLLIYIDISGLNSLLYINRVHQYVLLYILSYIMMAWGVGSLIAGILFAILGSVQYNFNSGKPLAAGIAVLFICLAISGFFIAVALPPANKISETMDFQSHFTEVNATKADCLNGSINSTYSGSYYLNSSSLNLNSGVLSPGGGTTKFSTDVATVFSSSGNKTIELTIISDNGKKTFTSWVYVYPSVNVSISGPSSVNDASGSAFETYSSVSSGYGPDNYTWRLSAFYIGDAQNASFNIYDKDMRVHFYLNSGSNLYGYNYTAYISLTVTTKFGDSYTYQPNFEGYQVSVVGN